MPPTKPKPPSSSPSASEPLAASSSSSAARAADELIALAIARAPQLYAAGITSCSVDGIAFTIGPPPPAIDKQPTPAPPTWHSDPLRDSTTFAGGVVPGFMRPDELSKKD